MVDKRPRLAASEIEEELLAELQKLPTLRDTQSVTIRPCSGPKSWTWELDRIEPEAGPEQSKFADVTGVVARLQQAIRPRSQPSAASLRMTKRRSDTNEKPAGGKPMRRFMVHLVTVVDFENGDEASDETVQNYQKSS